MITRANATEAITTAIENGDATAIEFNIEAIADALYAATGSWDVEVAETEMFWQIVQSHAAKLVLTWRRDEEYDRAVLTADNAGIDAIRIVADVETEPYEVAEAEILAANKLTRDRVAIVYNF